MFFKQHLTSKGKSQAVFTELRKMTSTVLWKCGKNNGIAVYILQGAIFKEMAAKIVYVKPAFLF
jgi:hypothetical protein